MRELVARRGPEIATGLVSVGFNGNQAYRFLVSAGGAVEHALSDGTVVVPAGGPSDARRSDLLDQLDPASLSRVLGIDPEQVRLGLQILVPAIIDHLDDEVARTPFPAQPLDEVG